MPAKKFHHILIEVAAKVLQRVHVEHQAFFFPNVWKDYDKLDTSNLKILCCDGIQLAYETAVTAAIATELRLHRAISGWVVEGETSRNYEIESEKYYREIKDFVVPPEGGKSNRQTADLWARRYDPASEAKTFHHLLVEAKFAEEWKYDGKTRTVAKRKRSTNDDGYNIKGVAEDALFMEWFASVCSDCYCWLLIWGIADTDDADPASEFWNRLNQFESLKNKPNAQVAIETRLTCWIPMIWSATKGSRPEIKKWIWVSLAEITISAER